VVGLCLIGKKLEICPIEIEKCIWVIQPKLVFSIREGSGVRRTGICIEMICQQVINSPLRWTKREEGIN
jgi:hypothetical protein